MARASTPTLLSLDRWAQIMGVSPVHFNGGDGNSINIFPLRQNCNNFWPQYDWQYNDRLSREDLARAIESAEQDIARAVGYFPAPTWIAQETHSYPRYHRRDAWQFCGRNVRGAGKSVKLNFGKFIQAGRRAVAVVEAGAAVVRTDPDGDGYDELATITSATALTNECEIKLYFAGHSGDPEWEIRPLLSKTITGGNVVIAVNSWQLFDPDLWQLFPGESVQAGPFTAIDINIVGNYVTTVDVYREYTDFSQASAVLYWEPDQLNTATTCAVCSGTGCVACSLTEQDGCIHMRGDPDDGLAVPVAATYSESDARWSPAAWSVCRDPDLVKVYYYSGNLADRWRTGSTCEALSEFWAQTIAQLATARLSKPPCSCNHIRAQYETLREDLALIGRDSSTMLDPNLLSNPFGTRRGEIQAWRRVQGLVKRRLGGGAI